MIVVSRTRASPADGAAFKFKRPAAAPAMILVPVRRKPT
jgi:hypothetical protein